jgi:hypothetical protein
MCGQRQLHLPLQSLTHKDVRRSYIFIACGSVYTCVSVDKTHAATCWQQYLRRGVVMFTCRMDGGSAKFMVQQIACVIPVCMLTLNLSSLAYNLIRLHAVWQS